jgi:hypothetical protein
MRKYVHLFGKNLLAGETLGPATATLVDLAKLDPTIAPGCS